MDRDIESLSGGASARGHSGAAAKADFYFFDEISPYLDIYQRINTARILQPGSRKSGYGCGARSGIAGSAG
jgi:ATP-binding cassette subfamily E protein 1